MSWSDELYQVYENNVGQENGPLPISHISYAVQVELTLTEDGEFVDAAVLDKNEKQRITIPATESSASRTGGNTPHLLSDKLQYLAGDFNKYANTKSGSPHECFEKYIRQLKKWKDSEYTHPALTAVYNYLVKETLMEDLLGKGIFVLNEAGGIDPKAKILGKVQTEIGVRFVVQYSDPDMEKRTWEDETLQQKAIGFTSRDLKEKNLCYGTGGQAIIASNNNYPRTNQFAKLFCFTDVPLSFRFDEKDQMATIGYEYIQKVNNALRWLIENHSISFRRRDGRTMYVVSWTSDMRELPSILNRLEGDEPFDNTYSLKKALRKMVWGHGTDYIEECEDNDVKVMFLILDASSKARMSIGAYSEMSMSEFYKNMEKWHCDTNWMRYDAIKKKYVLKTFSLYDIAIYAYGTVRETADGKEVVECSEEIKYHTIFELIPCVINGTPIPRNIIMNIFHRACSPMSFKTTTGREKAIEIACGMIRKHMIDKNKGRKEIYDMALDTECTSRDYLYGRLLAIAHVAEVTTYSKEDRKSRTSNAMRLFERFSQQPYRTWGILMNKLIPYLNKMNGKQRRSYEEKLSEVCDLFNEEDFKNNKNLGPEFLLAYYCQLKQLSGTNYRNDDEDSSETPEE